MTEIRGRALIINNNKFSCNEKWERKGSEVDVENLKYLLKSLNFEVTTRSDATAEVS